MFSWKKEDVSKKSNGDKKPCYVNIIAYSNQYPSSEMNHSTSLQHPSSHPSSHTSSHPSSHGASTASGSGSSVASQNNSTRGQPCPRQNSTNKHRTHNEDKRAHNYHKNKHNNNNNSSTPTSITFTVPSKKDNHNNIDAASSHALLFPKLLEKQKHQRKYNRRMEIQKQNKAIYTCKNKAFSTWKELWNDPERVKKRLTIKKRKETIELRITTMAIKGVSPVVQRPNKQQYEWCQWFTK